MTENRYILNSNINGRARFTKYTTTSTQSSDKLSVTIKFPSSVQSFNGGIGIARIAWNISSPVTYGILVYITNTYDTSSSNKFGNILSAPAQPGTSTSTLNQYFYFSSWTTGYYHYKDAYPATCSEFICIR